MRLCYSWPLLITNTETRNLVDSVGHGLDGVFAGTVHCASVIGGSPTGRVDVNEVGAVTHRQSLDSVCHKGLVQHPDAGYFGVVRDADSTDSVVRNPYNFTGASRPVAANMDPVKLKFFHCVCCEGSVLTC